jgi:hypothetical protein
MPNVTGALEGEPPPRHLYLNVAERETEQRELDIERLQQLVAGECQAKTTSIISPDRFGNWWTGHRRAGGAPRWRQRTGRPLGLAAPPRRPARLTAVRRPSHTSPSQRPLQHGGRQRRALSGKRSDDPPGGDDPDPELRPLAAVVPPYVVGLFIRCAATAGFSIRAYADRVLAVADFDLQDLEVFFDVVVAAEAAIGGAA